MTSSPATTRGAWTPPSVPAEGHDFVRASGPAFTSIDPATGEAAATVRASTPADVDAAVAAARSAFADPAWHDDGARRSRVLYRFAERVAGAEDRLAELLTREMGKTLGEAHVEVGVAVEMLRHFAGLARTVYGRAIALKPGVHGVVLREPLGVVGIITPWNWPLMLLVRSLAPALAAGNAAVVKPADDTAAVSIELLALLAADDELPAGAAGCVVGGRDIGEALVGHPGVAAVAFTGATSTGTQVMHRAADGLKPVTLELGGKSPNIVFADADLDKAMAGAESAIFTTSGQVCTAGSRLLVEAPVYDEVLERLAEIVDRQTIGDPLDPATTIGPLVSERQRRRVAEYVELGRAEGRVVAGGGEVPDGGEYVAPLVLGDVPDGSRLLREEIFGPVLCVGSFSGEEEARALANATDYGLAAAVWTRDLDRAWRMGRAIQAGTVWINTYHHFYDAIEESGFKHSGLGAVRGLDGLTAFTETKHLNFDSNPTLW